MVTPSKLAHVVFRTNRLHTMVNWYCEVLGAKPVFQNDKIAFVSYDDEHHRIAFVAYGPFKEKPEGNHVGFHHVAFTYRDLGELLGTYERLKNQGIAPNRPILHGPTCSLYYADPDGNGVELQIDSYADMADARGFMQGEAFSRDPIGLTFDPEEMLAKYRAGVPQEVLARRHD